MATWHDGIDPRVHKGLEIGALHNPRFDPQSPNVFFVDHTDTASLRRKYANDSHLQDKLDSLVDVDYVWGADDRVLAEVVKEITPVDFVYASHVFEHLANPVGWLEQVAAVLPVGGVLSLVIPDKRFCFDVNRDLTGVADLIDGYLTSASKPSFRQIYDFYSRMITVDTRALWAGAEDHVERVRDDADPDELAMEFCRRSEAGEYIDTHCGVYTPASFLAIVEKLGGLGLMPFTIRAFQSTPVNTLEFRVVLEKLPDTGPDRRREVISGSVAAARKGAGLGPGPASPSCQLQLGPRELRFILAKRRLMERAHGMRGRVRAWRGGSRAFPGS
mgnify:FL=1